MSKKFSIVVLLFSSLTLNGCSKGIDFWGVVADNDAESKLSRALAIECTLINGTSKEFCVSATNDCRPYFKEIFPDTAYFHNKIDWEDYYYSITRVAWRLNDELRKLGDQQALQSSEQVTEKYIEILTAYSTFTKGKFTSTDIQKIMMFRQQCYLDKFSQ